MSVDRKYIPGGSSQVDGNYETDHSIGSRAARLYMMRRGQWPGGRGRQVGSRLHDMEKIDDNAPAEAARMITEAFEPLTSSGEMSGLEVSPDFIAGRDDVLTSDVTWTDNTSGDSLTHERAGGRQG